MTKTTTTMGLATLPLLLICGTAGMLLLLTSPAPSEAAVCGPSGQAVTVNLAALPKGSIAGYSGQQLVNAALIMNAGAALGLNQRGQTIGVMTAMGESTLRVLDRGDAVGPDSRGLFQQRDNGAWGSYADRMDPTISATNFFKKLARVTNWQTLPPTIAAHKVQRNSDPYHYEKYWDDAVTIVAALAGVKVDVAAGTGGLTCTDQQPSGPTAEGWTKPTRGPVTSNYGVRIHPVTGARRMHNGTDIGAACDTPIFAAADGVVVRAGAANGYGNLVVIDHGGGVASRYAHMFNNGLLTRVGDRVKAGQQIARVGTFGLSTGCHLHYEIRVNDSFTDPVPFMKARGVTL